MEETSYEAARDVALEILQTPQFVGKVHLEGGLVPWIVSGNDSQRKHDDVDLNVRMKDLPKVRAWLQERGIYDPLLDARNLECNPEKLEYGIHAYFRDVMISFTPYEVFEDKLVQRNGVHASFMGYDALLEATIFGIKEVDFVEMRTLPNGAEVGMATLESVKAAKISSGREKDRHDIAEIDKIGIDEERYARVLKAFETMTIECPAHSD